MKVGARGYSAVYDEGAVQSANKIGKKFGTQREEGQVLISSPPEPWRAHMTPKSIHLLPITPALSQQSKRGFPLFELGAGATAAGAAKAIKSRNQDQGSSTYTLH